MTKYIKDSQASKDAAQGIAPRAGTLRDMVHKALATAGPEGMTDEQIGSATGLKGNTVRPRRVELVELGVVCKTKRRRKLVSGNTATVWVAVEHATEPEYQAMLVATDPRHAAPQLPDELNTLHQELITSAEVLSREATELKINGAKMVRSDFSEMLHRITLEAQRVQTRLRLLIIARTWNGGEDGD